MKRQFSYHNNQVALYLVATPIGNLEDITYRGINTLKMVDYIYAEDTRNSFILLNHYNINTPLLSYHEFNEQIKSHEIIRHLKDGKNVAIISDAGLPIISDPGFTIVKMAIDEDIAVTTIPGASAGISALIASGILPLPFTFFGFLDSKTMQRRKQLDKLRYVTHTIIFYEAPHRIKQSLGDLLEILGDRQIVLARELTKKFEEFIRGNISEVISICDNLKGEIVLIVSGYIEEMKDKNDILKEITILIASGLKSKDAIKEVAERNSLNKNAVYEWYLNYKTDAKE